MSETSPVYCPACSPEVPMDKKGDFYACGSCGHCEPSIPHR